MKQSLESKGNKHVSRVRKTCETGERSRTGQTGESPETIIVHSNDNDSRDAVWHQAP